MLEAPVSGSKVPAETGQLIFLCGGVADVYEKVSPALDCMGKAKFHFGPVGQVIYCIFPIIHTIYT